MIASTVSSKMLQAMAREEGFMFEVGHGEYVVKTKGHFKVHSIYPNIFHESRNSSQKTM